MSKQLSRIDNRRGVVTVEFALTAPVLFLLLLAAAELGHAYMVFNVTEAAAFEGAREGIVPGATAADCENAALRLLGISRIDHATITVDPSTLTLDSDSVQVTISVPYHQNCIVAPVFTQGLVIERSCSLTREKG